MSEPATKGVTASVAPDPGLAAYIADNYGRCIRSVCYCRETHVWHGTSCLHWQSVKAETWEQFAVEMKAGVGA